MMKNGTLSHSFLKRKMCSQLSPTMSFIMYDSCGYSFLLKNHWSIPSLDLLRGVHWKLVSSFMKFMEKCTAYDVTITLVESLVTIYRFLVHGYFCVNNCCISVFCDIFKITLKQLGQRMTETVPSSFCDHKH